MIKLKTVFIISLILFSSWGHAITTNRTVPLVRIDTIRYQFKLLDYRLYLDKDRVFEGQLLKDLIPGKEYNFTVLDENNRLVFQQTVSFSPSRKYHLTASEPWSRTIYPRISILGGNMLSGGADYFVSRYTWLGAGLGTSLWYRRDYDAAFVLFNPYLEYGSYYIGDRSEDFRMGLGGRLQTHMVLPYTNWALVSTGGNTSQEVPSSTSSSLEIFMTVEYRIWTAELALRLDLSRPQFQLLPRLGIKF